jgi:hypothetical protein
MEIKVAELTVNELRQLIREEIQNTLFDLLDDPDKEMEIRDEILLKLTQSLKANPKLTSAQTVAKRLGLEW